MPSNRTSSPAFDIVRRIVLAAAFITAVLFMFGPNTWPLALTLLTTYGIVRWAITRRQRAKVRRAARTAERMARHLLR